MMRLSTPISGKLVYCCSEEAETGQIKLVLEVNCWLLDVPQHPAEPHVLTSKDSLLLLLEVVYRGWSGAAYQERYDSTWTTVRVAGEGEAVKESVRRVEALRKDWTASKDAKKVLKLLEDQPRLVLVKESGKMPD
jgi:hypothetical protein